MKITVQITVQSEEAESEVVREVACLEEYRPLLARQMTRPVRWTDAVATLLTLQPCTFLEIGPGSALRGLLRSQAPGVVTWSLGTWRGVSAFLASLSREAPLKAPDQFHEAPLKTPDSAEGAYL